MNEEIEKKLKTLKDEIDRLENFAKNEEQSPEGNIEHCYCVIRDLSGYGTEDWSSLMEWAKRQKGYMHLTMDPDNNKEALYFSATPNALTVLGFDRAGLYICTNEKFGPRDRQQGC